MILLEPGNRILEDTVAAKINANGARDPIDVRLCDFDDVSYRVLVDQTTTNLMKVGINIPCWRDIETKGGTDAMKKYYSDCLSKDGGLDGYDVTLDIDLEATPADKRADLIKRISLLKTNLIGGIFDQYFSDLENGKTSPPFKFDLRSDTTVYLTPAADRCVVVFAIDFTEDTDNVIARIFLQEFVETRRHLGASPPVAFSKEPPLELKHFGLTESNNRLGYVSFAIMKNHVDRGRRDQVVKALPMFRNYLQYHIKCSKTHFHSRMRARVVSLLQVLNRAKNEVQDEKVKRTMGGKVFKRK